MPAKIGNTVVGEEYPPFIIAEMSGNHGASLKQALDLVEAAAQSGANAIKLQTFDADSMTLKSDLPIFKVEAEQKFWGGRSLWDLYDEAKTPRTWHKPIFERARELGILCFSTPFDEEAVDFLERLDPPAYKVASFECTDIPLIKYIASTGRPMLISVGMATLEEIERTVDAAKCAGASQLVILKCTSTYPASCENANVRAIPKLRELFSCEVGFSDHTMGIGSSIAAVAMGATVIEKHFALSRSAGGTDVGFSLEPAEFTTLVEETRGAWAALGTEQIGPTNAEQDSLRYRRSIFAVRNIEAGEEFTPANVRRIRPGLGLEPRFYESIIGQRAAVTITEGTPLHWDLVDASTEL